MKKYTGHIVTAIIGLAIAVAIMVGKDIFAANSLKAAMHILVDAFFVPGILLACFGLLVFSSNEGTFDMLSYGMSSFINLFRKDMKKMKHKTFYDYRMAKHATSKPFLYIIFVGLFYIGISLICLAIYSGQA